MKILTLFTTTSLVVCLPILAQAQEFTSPSIVDYFASSPAASYIKPNSDHLAKTLETKFFLNDEDAYSPVGEKMFDVEFTQDMFKTDAAAFIKEMNASDFLDAKIKFYSKLNFSDRWQKHETPYHYMSGWLSLNHPPVKKAEMPLGNYVPAFSDAHPRPTDSTYFSPAFQGKLDGETGTELTFGNKVKPLFNSDAIKEKTRLVNDAKRYLFGSVMAIFCDPTSEEFVQALINKAQSGVKVTLMMEKFYMGTIMNKCKNRLRAGGVDVLLIGDQLKMKSLLTFFHAKFWVRDGEEAIVGGQNIVKFENKATGFNQLNRDSDFLMEGPAATDFADEYLKIWNKNEGRRNESLATYQEEINKAKAAQRAAHVRGLESYAEKLGNPDTRMKGACRALVQQPYNKNLSIAKVLRRYTEEAKQSVIMTSPEIDYDIEAKKKSNQRTELFHATQDAAARGVDMQLILNGVDGGNGELTAQLREWEERAWNNDKELKRRFFTWELNREPQNNARGHREFLRELQKTPGYHTWTHFNYMHAKQAYFDRIATSISSFNLDKASAERNYEAGAVCLDESLSNAMEEQLTLDLVNSTPVVSSNEDSAIEATAQN